MAKNYTRVWLLLCHLANQRALLVLGCFVMVAATEGEGGLAAHQNADTAPRLEYTQATVQEAAQKAGDLLHLRIVLILNPGHPARKIRASLSMPVNDPNDALNALAATFGLRWVDGPKPKEVLLIDKQDYQGTAAGLRQAVSDALPTDLREYVRPGTPNPLRSVEATLKQLETKEAARLEAASGQGPVAVAALDPSLSRPLLRYLDSFAAFKIGTACDRFVVDKRNAATAVFHYGPNPGGTKQFSFRIGNSWLSVAPE